MEMIKGCEPLSKMFNMTDPDLSADILVCELSSILETIAPSKIVQRQSGDNFKLDQDAIQKKM